MLERSLPKRLAKVQTLLGQEKIDCLLLGPSANMYYFTGLRTYADERLQLVVIPSAGTPVIIIPEMYREKAESVSGNRFLVQSWSDAQDPVEMLKAVVVKTGFGSAAVDDSLWAGHFIKILDAFPRCSYLPASCVVDNLRKFKDEAEVELLKKAGELADQVMEKTRAQIRPGVSEKELALFIENSFKQLADDISFKPIVASGPNGASPHHASGERKFECGDFVTVDCGGTFNGYCSDLTRTFCLGKAGGDMKEVYQAVSEANEKAFQTLEYGCSAEEADRAARKSIFKAGYGPYFLHRLGHGIGLEVHESPYLVEGNKEDLTDGMVFSIEPGIYLPGHFGVRIEDIVAMTSLGPRRLNSFTRELVELL